MIYLEFTSQIEQQPMRSFAVELPVTTIHEAARMFLAFEAGVQFCYPAKIEMTSIGTMKKRGVTYSRWSGL